MKKTLYEPPLARVMAFWAGEAITASYNGVEVEDYDYVVIDPE